MSDDTIPERCQEYYIISDYLSPALRLALQVKFGTDVDWTMVQLPNLNSKDHITALK